MKFAKSSDFSSFWALIRWIKENPGKSLSIDGTIFESTHLMVFGSLAKKKNKEVRGGGRLRILTEEQQAEIVSRWELGESQRKIARDYGCSRSTIGNYVNRFLAQGGQNSPRGSK